jgi:hypothetical protein
MTGRNGTSAAVVEAQVIHDFDALLAEAQTNDSPPIVFTFKGDQFTIPAPLEWSDEVLRLQSVVASEGMSVPAALVSMAEALLGDQYPRFTELGGNALKFNLVLDKMLGSSVGESSAS